jgi:hypothetical protein
VTILGDVTSQEADIVAVEAPEIAELLVGESLNRRGVEDPPGASEGIVDPELGDHGLAGTGRRRHHHRIAPQECADRFPLEVVERKGIEHRELLDRRVEFVRVRRPRGMVTFLGAVNHWPGYGARRSAFRSVVRIVGWWVRHSAKAPATHAATHDDRQRFSRVNHTTWFWHSRVP